MGKPGFWWPKAGLPSPPVLITKSEVKEAQLFFTRGSGGQTHGSLPETEVWGAPPNLGGPGPRLLGPGPHVVRGKPWPSPNIRSGGHPLSVKEGRSCFTPGSDQKQGERSPAFLHPWFWWKTQGERSAFLHFWFWWPKAALPSPLPSFTPVLVAKRRVKESRPSLTPPTLPGRACWMVSVNGEGEKEDVNDIVFTRERVACLGV